MSEPDKAIKPSWWTTLPGILTGIAALLTAIGGLVVGLNQVGMFSGGRGSHPSTQALGDANGAGANSSPGARTSAARGMGTLRTSKGEVVFDRIDYMSMGEGKVTVSQMGAQVDIPLDKIKSLTFEDREMVRIDYWNGNSEELKFDCSSNTPVRFYAGDKEFYYSNCEDFRVVRQLEFTDPGSRP